jgi:hypothetical protein
MTAAESPFAKQLLQELRAVVAANPAPDVSRVPARRHVVRSGVLVGGIVAGVTALSAGALVPGGSGSAYAVEGTPDGNVIVHTNKAGDAASLEQQLQAVGVRAVVTYLPPGKACKGWFEPKQPLAPRNRLISIVGFGAGGRGVVNISYGDRSSDQTLLLTTFVFEGVVMYQANVVEGTVAPCVLGDAPVPTQ